MHRSPSHTRQLSASIETTALGAHAIALLLMAHCHTWRSNGEPAQVRDDEIDGFADLNALTYLCDWEEARKHLWAGIGIDLITRWRQPNGCFVGHDEVDCLLSLAGFALLPP